MKQLVFLLSALLIAFSSIAQEHKTGGTISASYDDNFNIVVTGSITNKGKVNITSIEVIMFYGDVSQPDNMWKDIRVVQLSIAPGGKGNFKQTFSETSHNAKARSARISRVRFSDGSIDQPSSAIVYL